MTATVKTYPKYANGSVDNDVAKAMNAVDDMIRLAPNTHYNQARVDGFKKDLAYIINHGVAPFQAFPMMAHGSYKEVYSIPGIDDWVIKFFSNENPTENELSVMDAADQYDLSNLFLPTIFCFFDNCTLPADGLEVPDEDESDYTSDNYRCYDDSDERPYLVGFQLQRRCAAVAGDLGEVWFCASTYNDDPILDTDGKPIPYEVVYDTDAGSLPWLHLVAERLGPEAIYRLYDFILDYSLCDLHSFNLGYRLVGGIRMPVILDWMSAA